MSLLEREREVKELMREFERALIGWMKGAANQAENNQESTYSLDASSPVVTREKFAEITGLPIGVVRGQMDRGILPTLKIGKRRLVNLAKLTQDCIGKN